MTRKTALITGASGQDGSYLAEQLLDDGYQVIAYRRPESISLGNSSHLIHRLIRPSFPVESTSDWNRLLTETQPDEIYHLGANTFVPDSWHDPVAAQQAHFNWTVHLLNAVRDRSPHSRVLLASSSEIFGRPAAVPQTETTPLTPITPYGISKASCYWMGQVYRQRYGLFIGNAILYNHESPRRAKHFVMRKISHGVASILTGHQTRLVLGNLDVERDWGYAPEYVGCMRKMLNHSSPEDFVVGSGRLESLKRAVQVAFESVGLDWKNYVHLDPEFRRPVEPIALLADPSKARNLLGWTASTTMPEVIRLMVETDLRELRNQRLVA